MDSGIGSLKPGSKEDYNISNGAMTGKPRILISNDDGVTAPGLVALTQALNSSNAFCSFTVCGPSGERSAQSHCISIGKHLHAFNIDVPGAEEAFAVDGSPADSVMLALNSQLLKSRTFDLVVSGINRGDNAGLHVIYSGTVGAAREAACKDVPSIALSLDNYKARSVEHYTEAARIAVVLIKSMLGLNTCEIPRPLKDFSGYVLNVNFPEQGLTQMGSGLFLAHQSQHCHFPDFQELCPDPHFDEPGSHFNKHGKVSLRAFRNAAGFLREDLTPGSDSFALRQGWVSVTLLGLLSDIPLTLQAGKDKHEMQAVRATQQMLEEAGKVLDLPVKGTLGDTV